MTRLSDPSISSLPIVGKVLIYIFDPDLTKYLTFTQPDHPDAGRQIPAGTIEEGETPPQAALRELAEETGWGRNSQLVHFADTVYDMSAHKPEMHLRSWFFAVAEHGDFPAESWSHREFRAGLPGLVAEFSWTDVSSREQLMAGHSDLLHAAVNLARS
jgi:8-oxo-dGTP diphosphatase